MNMRRLMVAPRQFGANHGYTWESTDDPDTVPEAHHDYCSLVQDGSHPTAGYAVSRNR